MLQMGIEEVNVRHDQTQYPVPVPVLLPLHSPSLHHDICYADEQEEPVYPIVSQNVKHRGACNTLMRRQEPAQQLVLVRRVLRVWRALQPSQAPLP
jgi:hypothetical protein